MPLASLAASLAVPEALSVMAKNKKTAKLSDIDDLIVGVAVRPFTWKGNGIARGKIVIMDPETFGVHERVGLVERNDAASIPEPAADEPTEDEAAE